MPVVTYLRVLATAWFECQRLPLCVQELIIRFKEVTLCKCSAELAGRLAVTPSVCATCHERAPAAGMPSTTCLQAPCSVSYLMDPERSSEWSLLLLPPSQRAFA